MEKEEAIQSLSMLRIFDAPDLNEAVKMAVSAIRSQQTTAKLDRSRWEGCEICKNLICAICKFAACEYDDHPCDLCKGGSLHEKVSYCPYCGRPLNEEAWADLERRINNGTVNMDMPC